MLRFSRDDATPIPRVAKTLRLGIRLIAWGLAIKRLRSTRKSEPKDTVSSQRD